MELYNGERPSVFRLLGKYMRKGLYGILTQGPIPTHLAFILDGNRRFAKKHKLPEGGGHKAGFLALLNVLTYCYELGVKYATIYAFSIDNFRRKPHEVQYVMDLMLEKIEGMIMEESIINAYDICVRFVGNLKLLSEPVKTAADQSMRATANNSRFVLLIAVAYSSTDEIVHAVEESSKDKLNSNEVCNNGIEAEQEFKEANGTGNSVIPVQKTESYSGIKLVDLEKNTYINPYPDVLIRTSGETRLSNYLLWQTTNCILYSPYALWPEIGLRHVVWSVINFQRHYSYLEKHKEYLK
uniref:Alkyl transferase n=1 Tax=Hevea brasiliensis TaxID=3981 RepID=A9ZN23_HEVBR|nr:cis-prenyl transferase [Hevea brasiliensis]